MPKLTKIMVCLMFFSLPVMLAGQEIVKERGRYRTTIHQEFDVAAGGKIVVRDIRGNVDIFSWNKKKVAVEERLYMHVYTETEAQKIVDARMGEYRQHDNSIIVGGRGLRGSVDADFSITVPKSFDVEVQTYGGDIQAQQLNGTVNLRTSGGDIKIEDSGDDITLKTSGGDLDMKNIQGDLNARTSGGDIDVSNTKGTLTLKTSGGEITLQQISGKIEAATSGGGIDVRDCRASGRLRTSGGDLTLRDIFAKLSARTSGGDIETKNIRAPLQVSTSGGDVSLLDIYSEVTASTSGGDMELALALTDFSKPHSIALSTTGGDIDCRLPEKLPATILAEIRLGNWSSSWKRYDIYSDFPLTKNKVDEDGRKILRAEGEINGGGDPITLKTAGGDIHIKKLK